MIEITMSERQQEYLRAFLQPRIVGLERAVEQLGGTAPEREAQELYNIVMGPMQEVGESPEADNTQPYPEPDPEPEEAEEDPPPTPAEEEDTSNPEEAPADTGLGSDMDGPVDPPPDTPSDKPFEPVNVQAGAMQPGTLANLTGEGKGPRPKPKGSARQGMQTTSDLKDAAS